MSTWVWVALAVVAIACLIVDLKLFAPGREATFREGVTWSLGWIGVALAAGAAIWIGYGSEDGITYLTVYAIERSLSLDNLFVFLLLFAYFHVPPRQRAKLLFWGIIAALVLRGLAILGGVALLEEFAWVTYVLGATLIILGVRIMRGIDEDLDPEQGIAVRLTRKVVKNATPYALCLVSIVAADIAFAVDSIPAAFAITRDSFLIWAGNVFALVGLRSLFVLVRGLVKRFRYLDQTIGIVLGLVGVKLILEELGAVHLSPLASLGLVVGVLAAGAIASVYGDRRDPVGAMKRRRKEEEAERRDREEAERDARLEEEEAEREKAGA